MCTGFPAHTHAVRSPLAVTTDTRVLTRSACTQVMHTQLAQCAHTYARKHSPTAQTHTLAQCTTFSQHTQASVPSQTLCACVQWVQHPRTYACTDPLHTPSYTLPSPHTYMYAYLDPLHAPLCTPLSQHPRAHTHTHTHTHTPRPAQPPAPPAPSPPAAPRRAAPGRLSAGRSRGDPPGLPQARPSPDDSLDVR